MLQVYAFPIAANNGVNQQTFPEPSIEECRHDTKNKMNSRKDKVLVTFIVTGTVNRS
jgi:hypothetical protein